MVQLYKYACYKYLLSLPEDFLTQIIIFLLHQYPALVIIAIQDKITIQRRPLVVGSLLSRGQTHRYALSEDGHRADELLLLPAFDVFVLNKLL